MCEKKYANPGNRVRRTNLLAEIGIYMGARGHARAPAAQFVCAHRLAACTACRVREFPAQATQRDA